MRDTLPTSDLKTRPVIWVSVGADVWSHFLGVGLDYLLSLNGIKAIGSPTHSDELI